MRSDAYNSIAALVINVLKHCLKLFAHQEGPALPTL